MYFALTAAREEIARAYHITTFERGVRGVLAASLACEAWARC